jgi:hypothetical protein
MRIKPGLDCGHGGKMEKEGEVTPRNSGDGRETRQDTHPRCYSTIFFWQRDSIA